MPDRSSSGRMAEPDFPQQSKAERRARTAVGTDFPEMQTDIFRRCGKSTQTYGGFYRAAGSIKGKNADKPI